MINSPKETEFPPREEGNSSEIGKATAVKLSSTASTNPTPWLRLKDPRIVRVSRVFGGKDRHSKVCTVRGLRDRRVRLSVPTAIQLYDLQDRLGLNQPSKVVDWLLNAAKQEIDELPPLPMPFAGNFSLFTSREANATATTRSQSNEDQGVLPKNNNNDMSAIEWELGSSSSLPARPGYWTSTTTTSTTSSDAPWTARSKEVAREVANNSTERENWRSSTRNNEVEKEEGNEIGSNLSQRTNNHPFFPGMLNSIAHLSNGAPNYRWEPPNYQLLSHLGGGHGLLTSQTDRHLQNLNVMSLQPSTLSLSTGSPLLTGAPGNTNTSYTTQTYFPSHSTAASVEIVDPRQVNHFQIWSSNLLPNSMRTFGHFGTSNPKLVGYPDQNDNGNHDHQQSKEQE